MYTISHELVFGRNLCQCYINLIYDLTCNSGIKEFENEKLLEETIPRES